jgi:hypothetical protein
MTSEQRDETDDVLRATLTVSAVVESEQEQAQGEDHSQCPPTIAECVRSKRSVLVRIIVAIVVILAIVLTEALPSDQRSIIRQTVLGLLTQSHNQTNGDTDTSDVDTRSD